MKKQIIVSDGGLENIYLYIMLIHVIPVYVYVHTYLC